MTDNELFKTILETFPFSVYIVDIATYQIIYANRSCIEAHGNCVNKTCYEVIYREETPCYYCRVSQLLKSESNKNLVFERFNELNECWYQHYEKILRWSDNRLVKYTLEVDISSLKAMQNQLAEAHAALALKNKELIEINQHDELTKAFNRSYLNQVLSENIYNMQRYQTGFSIALLDMDNFKKINDVYGHLVGDTVLIETVQLINQNIRQADYFGRWGGEEFMIIIPYVKTAYEVKDFLERLLNTINQHKFSNIGHCTCSIGVTYSNLHDTPISIVKNANDALYFAKTHGKNQVVIYDDITAA
ncbi:putative signaling protein [Patescibacteria group bacterium]|nr:putative signaling protein [Patescibacteria group bacterium]